MQMREKVGKSRFTVFFQWFVAPEGRKVGSLKRRVRSHLSRWEMKNCTPLWKFPSQNVQNTPLSDHFWKLQCRKSARRCGAKRISKSKCTKHTRSGPLLAVEMSKKCTPLWREAHFEVKRLKKNKGFGPLLEVQMSKKCMPLWREAHFEVKMFKTLGVRTTFGGSDVARFASIQYTTLHYTTLHYTSLPTTLQLQLHNYTPLHSTTLNSTTLNSTTLRYITLHYTTQPSTTLHYITLHSTTLQLQLQLHNYTPLH